MLNFIKNITLIDDKKNAQNIKKRVQQVLSKLLAQKNTQIAPQWKAIPVRH